MDSDVRISFLNDLRICQKCERPYFSHDIIPLCPDCRYEESHFHV